MAQPASAQIHIWTDAHGTLVLSDRPQQPSARRLGPAPPPTAPGTVWRRLSLFEPLIERHAERHSVRPDLIKAVIDVESAFDPGARSARGAMGLMQLMPATAAELGVADPYDPDENIGGGVTYLRSLLERYGGNEELALAAYNAGPGVVDRYGRQVPPYRETREYLARIRSSVQLLGTSGSAESGQTPLLAPARLLPRPSAISGGNTVRVNVIFRTVERIGDREIPRYTNVVPDR
jgi:hypothetical protein